MAKIRVRPMLLIKDDHKGISNHPVFGGRRVKKSLLPQIFKAEPGQVTPGREILGNSVWGERSPGSKSFCRRLSLCTRSPAPCSGVLQQPPCPGSLSAAQGSLVVVVGKFVAVSYLPAWASTPGPVLHVWRCDDVWLWAPTELLKWSGLEPGLFARFFGGASWRAGLAHRQWQGDGCRGWRQHGWARPPLPNPPPHPRYLDVIRTARTPTNKTLTLWLFPLKRET